MNTRLSKLASDRNLCWGFAPGCAERLCLSGPSHFLFPRAAAKAMPSGGGDEVGWWFPAAERHSLSAQQAAKPQVAPR